jgi:hypothetical protein
MASSRSLPRVGDRAVLVRMGLRREAEVIAVDGAALVVCDEEGAETEFALNELTGHWVRRGDPYYGLRLLLQPDER